jgi:hypothetical protein
MAHPLYDTRAGIAGQIYSRMILYNIYYTLYCYIYIPSTCYCRDQRTQFCQ